MEFRLDHVVIAVNDLALAIEDYRALGFNVVVGGRHPGRTSHNALIVFDDGAYLELIAWTEPGPTDRWYNVLREYGEGLMDFALIPGDVAGAIDAAKARGLALAGPLDGGRVRPDGREIRWQTARQPTFDLPFLCADVTPRELRVPGGEARRHPNGATGVASLVVAVNDMGKSLRDYAALLGRPVSGASITLGDTQLVLEESRARREGPRAMRLGSTEKSGTLDAARSHGAEISFYRRTPR